MSHIFFNMRFQHFQYVRIEVKFKKNTCVFLKKKKKTNISDQFSKFQLF